MAQLHYETLTSKACLPLNDPSLRRYPADLFNGIEDIFKHYDALTSKFCPKLQDAFNYHKRRLLDFATEHWNYAKYAEFEPWCSDTLGWDQQFQGQVTGVGLAVQNEVIMLSCKQTHCCIGPYLAVNSSMIEMGNHDENQRQDGECIDHDHKGRVLRKRIMRGGELVKGVNMKTRAMSRYDLE